jgi:hypothetical protein
MELSVQILLRRKQMTNGEKFKTAKERLENFEEFCDNHRCNDCRFGESASEAGCVLGWLDLGDMEDALKPCPFCGSGARLISGLEDHFVICCNDDCTAALVARSFSSPEEAIAAWNKRAK